VPVRSTPRPPDSPRNLVTGLLDIGEDFLRTATYAQATRALRAINGVGESRSGAHRM
jgi:DNA-3-methyladenine glycosylase II